MDRIFEKKHSKKDVCPLSKVWNEKSDARAFNGNVRQITNAREIIEIKKYMKPGEINVFSVNKLDPEDINILAANTIREVFHANLGESRR